MRANQEWRKNIRRIAALERWKKFIPKPGPYSAVEMEYAKEQIQILEAKVVREMATV